MRYWIIALLCWAAIYVLVSHAVYASPVSLPFATQKGFVSLPIVQSEEGKTYEARLQCDYIAQQCRIVYISEICQKDITHFSPALCKELQQ